VPSAFVVLESLPLTPNGKVDRRALPAPGQESYARREYEAPQGEIEVALAGIWQELLEVERVGRQDNFFDLGGHSLLATQVVEHIRRDLLVEVAVAELFERPVISSLSSHVDELRRNYFNDAITDGDTEELLRRVVEMSEDEAAILLREKATEEKS
jgi:hypothetical protein